MKLFGISSHSTLFRGGEKMAFQRRRHHFYQRFRLMIPMISAVAAALLFLFAVLSFLAPSPIESDQMHRRRHYTAFNGKANDAIGKPVFHVPKDGGKMSHDVWSSRNSEHFYGCSNASSKFPKAHVTTRPNRYLLIATSGGLNQQRTGITDAVVVARILNATLVVPKLDQRSYWKDSSNFSEIFDVNWFTSYLSNDVKIIKQLPSITKGRKALSAYNMRVPRKCNERCYINRILPVLVKKRAVQLNKFDYRLANRLDTEYQKLRCRVNYQALRFTDPIQEMGEKLVKRVRMRKKHYIALHLRFEPDMLAFSGCDYGGGEKEQKELSTIRRRWKTLHKSNPDRARRQGRCPLTPEEVGLMLRALGYGSDVHIYVASGEVYGGEKTLAPLKALFPNYHSKETITTKEELEPFSSFSSRMAALDFIVCDESDVFVTNNNGNMAKILAGRRRYFGHKPTIRPNAKKLYRLFLNRSNLTWDVFASSVRTFQKGFMGEPKELRPGRGGFHENPSTCICEDSVAKAAKNSGPRKFSNKKASEVDVDDNDNDDDDNDNDNDDDDQNDLTDKDMFNETMSDYETLNFEDPELEEIISD
ncbi:O-fucosyltransferase 16-like [Vicia villosa]|uniref:O-fucosyltransferase 16-like n=1 Tax=Vicia villosa TaxID=3911 RepID=UPI00273B2757|nr:O-fucosyltransferase 16-like [Vicia villosa]XP_058785524.1 O-fucosyltransferase 16-like [Vicia villosa]